MLYEAVSPEDAAASAAAAEIGYRYGGFVGSSVWGRVVVGLVRVCGLARFGAFWGVRDWSAGLWRVGGAWGWAALRGALSGGSQLWRPLWLTGLAVVGAALHAGLWTNRSAQVLPSDAVADRLLGSSLRAASPRGSRSA